MKIFPQLVEVYRKRWQGKNLTLSFAGEKEQEFYRRAALQLASRELLQILTLELDASVIAFTLSAHHHH